MASVTGPEAVGSIVKTARVFQTLAFLMDIGRFKSGKWNSLAFLTPFGQLSRIAPIGMR